MQSRLLLGARGLLWWSVTGNKPRPPPALPPSPGPQKKKPRLSSC
uniref:Archaelysin family metallopeptidase 1 n=1 Tax=Macaca fascicularis TaxID=9541 RepID=A0A7N9DE38_MACFA